MDRGEGDMQIPDARIKQEITEASRQNTPIVLHLRVVYRGGGGAGDIQIPDDRIKQEITEALRLRGKGKNVIGLCGSDTRTRRSVTTAIRREQELFSKFVTATVTNKPNIRNIQTQIGDEIGLNFDDVTNLPDRSTSSMCFGNNKRMMTIAQRAVLLCAKMKKLQTVLVVLYDVHGRLDLGEIGIPFDEDHEGCKILLTSTSVEVLSDQMKVHKLIQTSRDGTR